MKTYCLMVMFFHVNTHEPARVPPALDLTAERANKIIEQSYTPEWLRSGIYPLIKSVECWRI